jgi:hypothetical protein
MELAISGQRSAKLKAESFLKEEDYFNGRREER